MSERKSLKLLGANSKGLFIPSKPLVSSQKEEISTPQKSKLRIPFERQQKKNLETKKKELSSTKKLKIQEGILQEGRKRSGNISQKDKKVMRLNSNSDVTEARKERLDIWIKNNHDVDLVMAMESNITRCSTTDQR